MLSKEPLHQVLAHEDLAILHRQSQQRRFITLAHSLDYTLRDLFHYFLFSEHIEFAKQRDCQSIFVSRLLRLLIGLHELKRSECQKKLTKPKSRLL